MLNVYDILETIRMIQDECLDIRTTTMGISLLDCIDTDIDKACDKVYEKIVRKAERLVPVGQQIEKEYGIPIINKRISVTPVAMLAAACPNESPVKFAKALQRAVTRHSYIRDFRQETWLLSVLSLRLLTLQRISVLR